MTLDVIYAGNPDVTDDGDIVAIQFADLEIRVTREQALQLYAELHLVFAPATPTPETPK